jgi:NAD(P)-dependent dehydrogenase (short-subunit alcohol dehydrogenase family)
MAAMISDRLRNPLSLFEVRGKVAIITGASGSFGHACAVALGALGGKLLLASGAAEDLEAVVSSPMLKRSSAPRCRRSAASISS